MRVERGRDAAHEKARVLCDCEAVAIQSHDAVGNQRLQTRCRFQHCPGLGAMTRADVAEIGAELAHDAFDDVGAQPVVVGEPIAFRGGQMARADALRIGADLHLVLDIALRQMSDRARAEAEQNFALVGGVALKITPQRALLEATAMESPGRAK